MQRSFTTFALLAAAMSMAITSVSGQTVRYPELPGQIRVEVHLLPAVSTGPLDPAWSPDGQWIAFSMRGDIWKVPANGGEAIALTRGPGYHFEPAWSPNGSTLALTVDTDGNLDIATVSAHGGPIRPATHHPHVDIQPTWGADGQSLIFVSGRDGNLDIFRVSLATGTVEPMVTGRGHQIQPSVAPDGERMAFITPVAGVMGSGGISVMDLTTKQVEQVHYEETSYRAKPSWTPDGSGIVYVTDAAGSNDIAIVPATGGNRVRLTEHAMDEYAPVMSPDGSVIAFVTNRNGPTSLVTMAAGGGAGGAWTELPITSRRASTATGRLRGRVTLGGSSTPARIHLLASDRRAYTPDGAFHRVSSVNELHYFHTGGTFEVELPAGPATVEATRGFEFLPTSQQIVVPEGGVVAVELQLERMTDPRTNGWYSGDTHAHDLHQGRFGLTHEAFFTQLVADDLHVTNDLIHMDGTKLMGRWSDLTGTEYAQSTADYILRYSQEFRGSYGHVALLGVHEFIMPLIGGAGGTPYAADVLKVWHMDQARAQGGVAGFVHPYNGSVSNPAGAAQSDIPVHVALGRGDFFDVVSIASDELASAEMYYRMLNSGLRIPATGGTDNFSDAWRDPSAGTARTYAHINGPLSYSAWLDAIRAGRTTATNGPLLFATVNGVLPGSEIALKAGDAKTFDVQVEMVSIAPVDRLEILVNGKIAHALPATGDGTRFDVAVPVEVAGSGWIAARVVGDRNRYVGDNYAFAHTTPVYVVRDGLTYTSADDADFLIAVIDELQSRVVRRNAWANPADRDAYLSGLDEARAVYRRAADASRTNPR
jgi:Tol biopolymer transport system component